MKQSEPHNPAPFLIAITGLIGVGKTTLAGQLATLLDARLIHEDYGNNPFLTRQFQGDRQAALPSELTFLLSRARQLDRNGLHNEPRVVCDYLFDNNRLFAAMSLDEEQFALYDRVEQSIAPYLTRPGLVVYLTDTVANCLQRIAGRGRHYEQTISPQWLARLQARYDALFAHWTACPLLRIDCTQCDFRRRNDVLDVIASIERSLHPARLPLDSPR